MILRPGRFGLKFSQAGPGRLDLKFSQAGPFWSEIFPGRAGPFWSEIFPGRAGPFWSGIFSGRAGLSGPVRPDQSGLGIYNTGRETQQSESAQSVELLNKMLC